MIARTAVATLAAALALGLSACSGDDVSIDNGSDVDTTESTAEPSE